MSDLNRYALHIVSSFKDSACRNFDFLCSRYGFRRTESLPERVRYESDNIFFNVTTDVRDGVCVEFGRFGKPAASPDAKEESLSLGTFLAAIRTQEGTYRSDSQIDLGELALGLDGAGRGLITGDDKLYRLVRELRFWHVGEWTARWGTAIVLSPEEVQHNRELMLEILSAIRENAA